MRSNLLLSGYSRHSSCHLSSNFSRLFSVIKNLLSNYFNLLLFSVIYAFLLWYNHPLMVVESEIICTICLLFPVFGNSNILWNLNARSLRSLAGNNQWGVCGNCVRNHPIITTTKYVIKSEIREIPIWWAVCVWMCNWGISL